MSRGQNGPANPIRVASHSGGHPSAGANGGTFPKEVYRMETSHLSALQSKHAGIERQLADELARPAPNGGLVTELKRRKLRLKEELARFH